MQPTPSTNRELDKHTRVTRLRRNSAVILLIFVVIVVAALAGFRHAGRWLVHEDPLSHADVIFVLSGGLPYRAEEAGKVFAMGYAPEVWVSRPERPGGKLEEHRVHLIGEEEYKPRDSGL